MKLSGAFLTEGLKQALLLPLIIHGRTVNKTLRKGNLYVQLVSSAYNYYTAHGTVVYDSESFRCHVRISRALSHNVKLIQELGPLGEHNQEVLTQLRKDLGIPDFFQGVDKDEYYELGEIENLVLEDNQSSE
jgi:hypothetical protein